MRYYKNKHAFYNSKEFSQVKQMLMHKRVNEKGEYTYE